MNKKNSRTIVSFTLVRSDFKIRKRVIKPEQNTIPYTSGFSENFKNINTSPLMHPLIVFLRLRITAAVLFFIFQRVYGMFHAGSIVNNYK